MIDEAVAKFGVRGLARELGLSPAYVSMLASGQRAMTEGVAQEVGELVNTLTVHNSDLGSTRSAPGSRQVPGSRGRTRTYDQSINSRPLYH